ncbi:MAG TPA: aminoglycoside phosphotransferase family protein [Gaiellaceae bacterium]|nr:aminoglycoside phosphotransferase family protein [Gaiellaceae bacterium]
MSALDIERHDELVRYLRESGRIAPDERPAVRTLGGGVSNRTVLLERESGEQWVLKQALEKLRVQADWFCPPERIHREALGLHWLARLAPAGTITPFVFEDRARHVLAMAAVPQPHENWKTMLLAGDLRAGHVERFGLLLRSIHRNALEHRRPLRRTFGDRSFFERLRLEPYYAYAGERVPEAAGFLAELVAETRAHRDTLVHGDFSPKNVLVRGDELVLVDHEVVHFGDPAFDLGFSLAHLLSKAHHLRDRRDDFAAAALLYWRTYAEDADPELEPRAVRHTLACLLARVAGRSPLEYLDDGERARQQAAVLALLPAPPQTLDGLVEGIVAAL